MPKADADPTTIDGDRGRTPDHSHSPEGHPELAGDQLISILAARWRAADDAAHASNEEEAKWDGSMHNYFCWGQTNEERQDVLLETICMIPASGLAGAMIQIEAIDLLLCCDNPQERFDSCRQHAVWSVHRVLAGATGRTAASGLRQMLAFRDPFRTGLSTLVEELKAQLGEWGFPVVPSEHARGRA